MHPCKSGSETVKRQKTAPIFWAPLSIQNLTAYLVYSITTEPTSILVVVSVKSIRKSDASTPAVAKSNVIVLEFAPAGSVAANTIEAEP